MYCIHCGKQIDDKAVICPECGVPTANMQNFAKNRTVQQPQAQKTDGNVFAVIGFTLSLSSILLFFIFFALYFCALIAAFTLSIIGLVKSKTTGKGKGLSIAGIVISSALFVLMIVLLIIFVVYFYSYLMLLTFPYTVY